MGLRIDTYSSETVVITVTPEEQHGDDLGAVSIADSPALPRPTETETLGVGGAHDLQFNKLSR